MSIPSRGLLLASFFVLGAALYIWFVYTFPAVWPQLSLVVPRLPFTLAFFENNPNAYNWLNGLCVLFPFLLSFDKKVAFFRHWKFLFPATALTGAFFLVWDIYFAQIGVWGFNPRYANHFFLGLPLGEWLFFLVVPYCCMFVYACLNAYLPNDPLKRFERWLDYGLLVLFLVVGLLNLDRAYTATAFLGSAVLLWWHIVWWRTTYRSRMYLAYFVCLVPFLLVNGVLTGSVTAQPVVCYTDAHNLTSVLGGRCGSIPWDDFAYNFLLLGMCVTWMEWLRAKYPR